MRVNRLFLCVVSQDEHAPGDPDWSPIWNGKGGIRVYALDRERCLLPADFEAFKGLLLAPDAPGNWNEVPPTTEPVTHERSSRQSAAT